MNSSFIPQGHSRRAKTALGLSMASVAVFLFLWIYGFTPRLLFSVLLIISSGIFIYLTVRHFLVEYEYSVTGDGESVYLNVSARQGRRRSLLAHISLRQLKSVWVSDSEIPLPNKGYRHSNLCRDLLPDRFARLVFGGADKTETVDIEYDDTMLSAIHTALLGTDDYDEDM